MRYPERTGFDAADASPDVSPGENGMDLDGFGDASSDSDEVSWCIWGDREGEEDRFEGCLE